MDLKINTCSKCGQKHTILPSNNPLVPKICTKCVIQAINYNDMEQADFFCRTYNIPFDPNIWIKMAKEYKENMFKHYVDFHMEDEEVGYEHDNMDLWKEMNKEWGLVQTHEELISRIKPIKQGYMLRNQIKWGTNYTFEELIMLESLYLNTLRANDVSNPMQKDAIKKACKMSIALDRAILNGDSKEINELSKAYQNFVKTAKIDDLITASSQEVISNVAQLVKFIEDEGFQFTYYDNVDRDIVDKSMKDMQEFLQRLVLDATGLESVFETINNALKTKDELEKESESFKQVPLEELYSAALERQGEDFDKELESEEIFLEEDDEEDELF